MARLDRAKARLLETVAALDDTALKAPVPAEQFMLHGLMHHNAFHGARIAILRKERPHPALRATFSPQAGRRETAGEGRARS